MVIQIEWMHEARFIRLNAEHARESTWPATEARLYEYACHEGNCSLGNVLRGARLLEEELAAKSGSGQ